MNSNKNHRLEKAMGQEYCEGCTAPYQYSIPLNGSLCFMCRQDRNKYFAKIRNEIEIHTMAGAPRLNEIVTVLHAVPNEEDKHNYHVANMEGKPIYIGACANHAFQLCQKGTIHVARQTI